MKLLILLLGSAFYAKASTFGTPLVDTIADCKAFEASIDCTHCANDDAKGTEYPYDPIPNDGEDIDYELVKCTFPGICPDGTHR